MKVYAAYGSNINLEQMAFRCPTGQPIGKGWLMDYKLMFLGGGRCGVATVEPHKGRRVPILLLTITEKCEKALDIYEGYPSLYRKETLNVKGIEWLPCETVPPAGDANVEAMIYIMNYGHIVSPGQNYLACIMEGYRSFGFHPRYLSEAVRRTERSK